MTIFYNRAVNETMQKNKVQPDKPQITIQRMRFACCIPKSTYKPSQDIYCFSTTNMIERKRLNVTLYVHFMSSLLVKCFEKPHINLRLSVIFCDILTDQDEYSIALIQPSRCGITPFWMSTTFNRGLG